jgi:GcrA cell cycle regulator
MASPSIFWTIERIDQLKSLHAKGYSNSVIGGMMGCSRNAAIGKLHRLGLTWPNHQKRIKEPPRPPVERKPIHRIRQMGGGLRVISTLTGDLFEPRCVELVPRNLTLMELEPNDCRYIAGNDLLYCAHPQLPGSSYCPNHHRLVWVKPQPSKPRYMREAA